MYVAITGVLFPKRSVLKRIKFDHAERKLKTVIDTIPGFTRWMITCLKPENLVHPSTRV